MIRNVQFRHGQGPRDFLPMRSSILALRVTPTTLEFPFWDAMGLQEVVVLRGQNLNILAHKIVHERVRVFELGKPIVERPYVCIEGMTKERKFTVANGDPVPPERNPVPGWLFCLDRGCDRWYLDLDALEAWGCPQSENDYRLFLQFRGSLSFILTPKRGDFDALLEEFKASNFDFGTTNKVSPFSDYFYSKGGDKSRYRVATVEFHQRDIAASGQWTLGMDRRLDVSKLTPELALKLGYPSKVTQRTIRPAVSMDL